MPTRDNIIMMEHRTPKKIELLDGWVFFAWSKKVRRDHLSANIRMRQRYRQRAACRGRQRHCHQVVQRGQGLKIGGLLRTVFSLSIKNRLFKKILISN